MSYTVLEDSANLKILTFKKYMNTGRAIIDLKIDIDLKRVKQQNMIFCV